MRILRNYIRLIYVGATLLVGTLPTGHALYYKGQNSNFVWCYPGDVNIKTVN